MTDSTNQNQDPKEYSVSELDAAVMQGTITQTQRDQIWSQQIERKAMRQAEQVASQIVETQVAEQNLDQQLKQYASANPDVMREGSSLRQKVAAEYQYLVEQGAPANMTTELAAVRSVMGPIERIRQHQQGRTRGADAMSDTYGSQPMSPKQRREEDAWSRLEPSKRAHYERLIQAGVYAGRGAALAELSWRRGGSRGTA